MFLTHLIQHFSQVLGHGVVGGGRLHHCASGEQDKVTFSFQEPTVDVGMSHAACHTAQSLYTNPGRTLLSALAKHPNAIPVTPPSSFVVAGQRRDLQGQGRLKDM